MGTTDTRRRRREMPAAERAKRLGEITQRMVARQAADPSFPYQQLYKLVAPSLLQARWSWPTPLHQLYTEMRRAYVVRAWAASRVARITGSRVWRRLAVQALADARRCRVWARHDRERRR